MKACWLPSCACLLFLKCPAYVGCIHISAVQASFMVFRLFHGHNSLAPIQGLPSASLTSIGTCRSHCLPFWPYFRTGIMLFMFESKTSSGLFCLFLIIPRPYSRFCARPFPCPSIILFVSFVTTLSLYIGSKHLFGTCPSLGTYFLL